jgi:GDP-L-fucose synthase
MSFWDARRVMVTGGRGFLGSRVVELLAGRGAARIFAPDHASCDLVTMQDVELAYQEGAPDVVIHLAAHVGGIGANQRNPGAYFFDNAMMGLQVMEVARRRGVEKFVAIGTICAYPKHTPVPFREEDLWNGYPEETNAPYGLAKKMMLVQAQAYRQQYGFNAIYLLPVNLYGPGDDFDPETSHVIPALIRKCVEAGRRGQQEIVAWGSGEPTREFLYVDDAAEGIVLAAERYNEPGPVNLGSGRAIRIRDLLALIAELTGFTGRVRWDASRPDGQPARQLEVSRARDLFGFSARTDLEQGLARTVEYYTSQFPGGSQGSLRNRQSTW